jgi:hypothetical protein
MFQPQQLKGCQYTETLDNIGIKLSWLHWKNTSCENLSLFLFCLRCVVPVSIHYRFCLVTVRTKELQNWRLVRFSKLTDFWCAFRWSICNQIGHGESRAAVSNVMMAYSNHGKTSSTRRNSGRKLKLSERDHRTLKRTVSKDHRTALAKLTAEPNIHLEDRFPQKESDESFTNTTSATAKPLITENNATRRKKMVR